MPTPLIEAEITHRAGDFTLDFAVSADASPLVIIGPSGSGKTMTLRAMAGIVRPGRGRLAVNGRLLFDSAGGIDLPAQYRRVGYVPQDYALFPNMTVEGNIGYGLRRDPGKRARVAEMLALTGLEAQSRLRPRELSGGQRQRVALARALAVRPDLLLLDEPLAALDAPARAALMLDLQRLIAVTETPTIFVTHDRNEALQLGARIAVLIDGRTRQSGSPSEVFGSPADEEVASFVGAETVVLGRVHALKDGVALVDVAGRTIEGGTGALAGESVIVCLRPEDIVLGPQTEGGIATSARNHLPATVSRLVPSGPYIRVELDAGFPLVALVTKHSLEDLALIPGSRIVATFKAAAVHLIRKVN